MHKKMTGESGTSKLKLLPQLLVVSFVVLILFFIFDSGPGFYSPAANSPQNTNPASVNTQEILSQCQQYYRYEFPNATVYGTFEQYPVAETYTGPIATVDEDSDAVAKRFYTHHKNALAGGVNFAGKYAISDWGFTSIGGMFAVVDVETGDVYPFPYVVDWDFDFRPDSNLIVINPIDSMPDFVNTSDYDCTVPQYMNMKTYYFLFEDAEFRLLGPEDITGLRTNSRLKE